MMKRKSLLAVLLGILLLFTGCQSAPSEEGTQPVSEQKSGTEQERTPEGNAEKEPQNAPVAGSVVGAADSAGKKYTEKDNFSYKEIEKVFSLTRADVVSLYGEPKQSTKSDFENSNVETLEYDGALFDIDFVLAPETGKVFNAEVNDGKLGLPRGLKIGDPIEVVATKFPYRDTDVIVPEGDGTGYIKMYGDPTTGGAYGIIEMNGETPTSAIYADEVTSLTFRFTEGMLVSVTYTLKLN